MHSAPLWYGGLLLATLFTVADARGAQPPPQGKNRADLYGDPLPEGVLVRLGTARLRHGNGMSLAFAPDGKTILTSGTDRTIRYWDVASGRQLREQLLPDGPSAFAPVLSPDGRLAAYQEDWETVVLWDVARHQPRH
jgi:hypothetical protein